MVDKIHKQTDIKLADMERHLSAIYSRAQKEIGISWKEYLKESGKELSDLQKQYEKAKQSGDRAEQRKLGIKLQKAKRAATLQNDFFKNLSVKTAGQISHVNEIAMRYVNGELPEIYAMNYNYLPDQADLKGYSFTLTDENTIKNLIVDNPDLLPQKSVNSRKDIAWNKKSLNAEVLQGILQGEPMDKIANRLSKTIGMNGNSAIRTARTAVTSAECKGRLDSYAKAEKDGIILKKEWVSTNDGRTRHAHRMLSGQQKNQDEPFESELGPIMYPGDSKANPSNVYN